MYILLRQCLFRLGVYVVDRKVNYCFDTCFWLNLNDWIMWTHFLPVMLAWEETLGNRSKVKRFEWMKLVYLQIKFTNILIRKVKTLREENHHLFKQSTDFPIVIRWHSRINGGLDPYVFHHQATTNDCIEIEMCLMLVKQYSEDAFYDNNFEDDNSDQWKCQHLKSETDLRRQMYWGLAPWISGKQAAFAMNPSSHKVVAGLVVLSSFRLHSMLGVSKEREGNEPLLGEFFLDF